MSPPTPEESMWKARTLDQLDAALHPVNKQPESGQGEGGQQQAQGGKQNQSGQQQGSQSQSAKDAAAQAMSDAAQAQKAAMMAARNNGTPGQPGSQGQPGDGLNGAFNKAVAEGYGVLPEVRALRTGDWGKLPPKVAEGLLEARRENMPAEYRAMVETYFRVIAERARDKK